MKTKSSLVCCGSLLGLVLSVPVVGVASESYHLLKEIPVGGEGGWDYLSVDSAAHRLYVSHATQVVVIDTASDKVVGEIADTPGVHGLIPAPDLGRGFTSNGRENKASIVDRKSLQTLGKVATGLEKLATGELTFRVEETFPAEYEKLRHDFNGAMETLQQTMQVIGGATQGIRSGADEISRASGDLSQRTEQQAASLEETAAALDEITATVRKTAESATHARRAVVRGLRHRAAGRGGGGRGAGPRLRRARRGVRPHLAHGR